MCLMPMSLLLFSIVGQKERKNQYGFHTRAIAENISTFHIYLDKKKK